MSVNKCENFEEQIESCESWTRGPETRSGAKLAPPMIQMHENPGAAGGGDDGVVQDAQAEVPNPVSASQPRAAAGAGRRASAMLDPTRTKKERIRLDDCKNVIELMDEVQQGKQRATLAALESGIFGGVGTLAQVLFTCIGIMLLAVAVLVAALVSAEVVFESGFFVLVVASLLCVARAWYLRQLKALLRLRKAQELQPVEEGHALLGLDSVIETDDLNSAADRSLLALGWVAALFLTWLDVYYFKKGGSIVGLEIALPAHPSAGFYACFVTGMGVTAVITARFSWLLLSARVKKAQAWLVAICASAGTTMGVLSALSPRTSGHLLLGVISAGFLGGGCAFYMYLRHRQNAAMTAELMGDIVAYEQAWSKVRYPSAG
jgi:hypothetical protein